MRNTTERKRWLQDLYEGCLYLENIVKSRARNEGTGDTRSINEQKQTTDKSMHWSFSDLILKNNHDSQSYGLRS